MRKITFLDEPAGLVWLFPSKLAGMPLPSANDIDALAQIKINVLISLTEKSPRFISRLKENRIQSLHFPIQDFLAPDNDQAIEICQAIKAAMDSGEKVVVHCKAGQGRTGTVLAAYLIWLGQSAKKSISQSRRANPAWIETKPQLNFLFDFETRIKNPDAP